VAEGCSWKDHERKIKGNWKMKTLTENLYRDLAPQSAAELSTYASTPARTVPGADATPAGRIPALDGLRGVAILSVMAFHFWMFGTTVGITFAERAYNSIASKGWVGVDLFFVLSGFLITGILYDSRQDPRYYRVFYARRTVRIFPLYYASLALFFFLIPWILRSLHPVELVNVHTGATAKLFAWTYLLNWIEGLKGFSVAPLPLQHFWSLAIEEQFYLVWPFLVLTLARRRLMWLCMGLMVLAFALRVVLYRIHLPEAA
jgi:peptidoglycan/LPS O-acetylase OafA/YrhL